MCFSLIFGTLLTANGSLRILNQVSFLAIILNITLNVFLIPKYGAMGAAITAFSTQFFVAMIQLITIFKYFKIEFKFVPTIRYLIFAICLFLLFHYTSSLLNDILKITIQLIVGFILLFVFKLIDLKGIVVLLKSKEH
jgi:O-antigen/teichoic acid export membrane protein